ncbi:MAG: mandelate racemase/muconate lactonizing enzyme family protein [Clostridium sp.]|nr:mandelate racemase/muconate lactonizing enzyme family protein [Clostridium sp.]
MIITKVEPIMLQYQPQSAPRDGLSNIPTRDVLLVKIETDEGITGIGEGFALGALRSTATMLEETLSPLLIGADPTRIEFLWKLMYKQTFRYGRRGALIAALSAVDIALWDILGKKANLPVYRLLGGSHNTVIPYASAGYYMEGKTIEDLAREAESYEKKGFHVMKMKIGGASIQEDQKRIEAVKEAVSNDFKLAVDANNAYDFDDAVRMGRFLEKHDIFFFEEPISSDFVMDSSRLAALLDVPIAGYETQLTRFGAKELLLSNAVDIVQVDAIWTGGISDCYKIGVFADTWNRMLIPHFSASMVSFAANLQLAFGLSNTKYMEYTLDENPLRDQLCENPIVMADGVLKASEAPGIGVILNHEIVDQYRVY